MSKNHIKVFIFPPIFFAIVIFPTGCCNYKGIDQFMQSVSKRQPKIDPLRQPNFDPSMI